MKIKILLSMLLAIAVTAELGAQDQEQTAAPSIVEWYNDHYHSIPDDYFSEAKMYDTYIITYNYVTFENNDESEVTIYYRYGNGSEWNEYNSESQIAGFEYRGTVEAYAVAEGKLPSEIVSTMLYQYDIYLYSTCVVDGIHYYFEDYYLQNGHYMRENPSFVASVCSRKESQLYSLPYSGDILIPGEIEIRGNTYVVTGIRNAAFASTLNQSCDIVSVELPNTIEEIGPSAFAGCTQLKRMIVHTETPPYTNGLFEYEYGDENYDYYNYIGFDGNTLYDRVTLFVPNVSLEAYRDHAEWGKFSRIVPFLGAGPGDINGDGGLSVTDAIDLISQLLNNTEYPAYCDVNGDGEVNINDVINLINILLNTV